MENISLIDLSFSRNKLGLKTAEKLGIKLENIEVSKFYSGETIIDIRKSLDGKKVFILQTFDENVNDQIMEILLTIDALKRSSVKEIVLVIPLFPYSRQDRKTTEFEPISAKVISSMLQNSGIEKIISFDIHSNQIEGFFDIPFLKLSAIPHLTSHIIGMNYNNLVVVSPDHGGVSRARSVSQLLDCDIAIINKQRPERNKSEVKNIIGEVKGKTAIIVDDMIDTAGSLCNAAEYIIKSGASEVIAIATHPILSNNAISKIEKSSINKIIVSDSVSTKINSPRIKRISISNLVANAIKKESI